MKRVVLPTLLLVVLGAACGKVGNPKPPINRSPLAANGVTAGQSDHTVTLSWTNPARYADNNGVTDLAYVRILRNGVEIAREKALPAGQPQSYSYSIDVTNDLNAELTFAVQAETARGRLSPLSETVRIQPREVPGAPRLLPAVVDLDRIALEWLPSELKPELAEVFLIKRSDRPNVVSVATNHYEDGEYEPGKKYDYVITAARAGNPVVPGAAATVSVTAKDTKPPAVPTGLQVDLSGPTVILTWDMNKEKDFKEYRIYRSDQENPIFPPVVINFVTTDGYRAGLTYQIEAVDKSGNRSDKSAPKGVE